MATEVITCYIKIPLLVKIDTSLAKYYKDCGRQDYFNKNGQGKFRVFMTAMDFDDDIIKIQLEYDLKQAKNCKLVEFDKNFPILNTNIKNEQERIEEIFKILQNCYLYGVSQPVIDNNDDDDDDKYNDDSEDDCDQEACIIGPDVSKSAVRQTGTNPYLYYKVSPGLVYGGICFNSSCRAFNQPITVHKKFGQFFPLQEQLLEEYGCPGCKKFFDLENLFLYKCDATVQWKKEKENKITKKEYSVDGNNYREFGVELEAGIFKKAQKAKFEVLKFTVKPRK